MQWLNQQYWDTENHTLGTADSGSELHFTFQTPIEGSEQDNFNTMIGTGEYTDLLDMSLIADPMGFYDDGVIMEITDYVEKYMPDYVAYLDANPSLKSQVSRTDEDGTTHYYYVANILDGPELPWGGFVYRRDWVVEYAEPTDYVWDWDSDYVKENGHPEVTPLEKAKEQNNLNGWKQNEVTEFTANQGEDPNNTYTDNVIFPSGTSDPLTISDWEWMFEAFTKAIDEKGFSMTATLTRSACIIRLYYHGRSGVLLRRRWRILVCGRGQPGILQRSFRQFPHLSGCLHNWYEQGWLDEVFETRTGDAFYMVNMNGTNMGKGWPLVRSDRYHRHHDPGDLRGSHRSAECLCHGLRVSHQRRVRHGGSDVQGSGYLLPGKPCCRRCCSDRQVRIQERGGTGSAVYPTSTGCLPRWDRISK